MTVWGHGRNLWPTCKILPCSLTELDEATASEEKGHGGGTRRVAELHESRRPSQPPSSQQRQPLVSLGTAATEQTGRVGKGRSLLDN